MNESTNTNKPVFITIVIATLNVEKTLNDCLQSIIQQSSFIKIEILIKDGGSTDKTLDILKANEKNITYWESSADRGIYSAWNSLLPRATGEWLLFLGADDSLFNTSIISKCISQLEQLNTQVELAYGRVKIINHNNEPIAELGRGWEQTNKCIKEKMCIPHQALFHKKSLFENNNQFNTDYQISSDYDFLKRALHNSGNNIIFLDMTISSMRIGGISSNPKYTFIRLNELRIINRNHGQYIPGPLWLITYVNTCFRHSLYFIIGKRRASCLLDKLRATIKLPPYWTKL